MERALRVLYAIGGVGGAVLAVGFITQNPLVSGLWPFQLLETRLGLLFLGSLCAAAAAPALLFAWTGEIRAAEAGAFNIAVSFGGAAAYCALRPDGAALPAAVVFGVGSVGMLALAFVARQFPLRDTRPTPKPVRWSFAVFAAVLVLAATLLIAAYPTVFPWPLAPESSAMYGLLFLGNAVYFVHGFLFPSWQNAAGQLLAFLAYDLVLIGPFLAHFATVKPDHLPSLAVYVAVLLYSGTLAAIFLIRQGVAKPREPADSAA